MWSVFSRRKERRRNKRKMTKPTKKSRIFPLVSSFFVCFVFSSDLLRGKFNDQEDQVCDSYLSCCVCLDRGVCRGIEDQVGGGPGGGARPFYPIPQARYDKSSRE